MVLRNNKLGALEREEARELRLPTDDKLSAQPTQSVLMTTVAHDIILGLKKKTEELVLARCPKPTMEQACGQASVPRDGACILH